MQPIPIEQARLSLRQIIHHEQQFAREEQWLWPAVRAVLVHIAPPLHCVCKQDFETEWGRDVVA